MSSSNQALSVIIAGLVAALISSPAFAGNIRSKTIDAIQTYESYAVVSYSEPSGSKQNCRGSKATYQVVVDWSKSDKAKVMYSALIAAHSMRKTVGFGTRGCHKYGGGTPLTYRVDMN